MKLDKYNEKRNFNNTNEPEGIMKKDNNNRFVIQYHKARRDHYDFRLQHNGVLVSFAIPKGLSNNPNDKRLAIKVEDHPIEYYDFEGIIPKGNYGAGSVKIYDFGIYLPLNNIEKGLKEGNIKFILKGNKYNGAFSLIHTNNNNWLIIKLVDDYSNEQMQKTNNHFDNIDFQLATLSKKIPSDKEYIFEIKYDGYRMMAYVDNKKVKILSRNQKDYTNKFNNIVKSLSNIDCESFIVDGEIVSFDKNGKSSFSLLQSNMKFNNNKYYYVIFDLLSIDGYDIRNLPLLERKKKLEVLLYNCDKNLIYSKHFNDGKKTFKFAKDNNLEGIIAKKYDSKYDGKRNNDWLKIKCVLRQEFVIAGFTTSSKNELISSLILGCYLDDEFVYVGKVGTGLNGQLKEELYNKFKKINRKTSPFKKDIKEKNVTFIKLIYIAEIQFSEFTKDNILRHPSFISLRNDKKAKEVKLEYNNGKN